MNMTSQKIAQIDTSYYDADRVEMLEYINRRDIRILDIGCGTGKFGQMIMQKRNAEVWGIEIEPKIAAIATKSLHKVLCGNAEELIFDLPDNTFDLICFNDSLEHLLWPEQMLQHCKTKLRDEGEILCSLPNMRYFRIIFDLVFKKKWEYEDAGILDKTHLRFFTINSIKNMFQRSGYTITVLEGNQAKSRARTKSWRYRIFQILTFGNAEDMRHGQFHIKANLANNR